MNTPLPQAPPNVGYCPGGSLAADPYNDVVIPMFQYTTSTNSPGKPQLAIYTADKYGKLATTSTYKTMPTPAVEPDFLALSPSGYYLAVMGYNGLQIFLMHGSNAPTALTGAILPGTSLGEAYFDYHQHLYVLGTNQVFVFNISTNGITQAPGSPFAVPSARHLIVLPK
jgi:hypothetical protein